jgi:hypothetical protein
MKTDELITLLVEDQTVKPGTPRLRMALYAALGLACSLAIFFAFLGIRADFGSAITDPHVVFKFIFAASLFAALWPAVLASTRPEAIVPVMNRLVLPAIILAVGIVAQLLTSPSDYWLSGMIGRYPSACLRSIPALAIGPLAVLLVLIHNGAPTRPVLSGALAGCAAGALSAFIYALHCPDDSSLFVALWYSLAIGIVTLLGAALGRYALKW